MLYCYIFRFSTWYAFRDVLKEIGDLAGQRELVAETLQGQVSHSISLLAKILRDDRKKCLSDGASLTHSLQSQLGSLDRAKRVYDKAFRDAEKAVESYQRADADLNLSRADVSNRCPSVRAQSRINIGMESLIKLCSFAVGGEA